MKQADNKELLLKDLSARLPYGVKVQFKLPDHKNKVFTEEIGELQSIDKYREVSINSKGIDYRFIQLDCKPYLRPISSMTKEELEEYNGTMVELPNEEYLIRTARTVDFCNKYHLDYRGFIPKGLALEAPEGMYA